jgi:dihydroxyacetone kinase
LPSYPLDDPAGALQALGATLQRALGGTSGPLYAAFFLRASGVLRRNKADDPAAWAEAFQAGCAAISEMGGAGRGDRTMLDALLPAAEAFAEAVKAGRFVAEALRTAASAATDGARATAELVPRRGRSSYLAERAVGHPDPGAEAVAVWLAAVARADPR